MGCTIVFSDDQKPSLPGSLWCLFLYQQVNMDYKFTWEDQWSSWMQARQSSCLPVKFFWTENFQLRIAVKTLMKISPLYSCFPMHVMNPYACLHGNWIPRTSCYKMDSKWECQRDEVWTKCISYGILITFLWFKLLGWWVGIHFLSPLDSYFIKKGDYFDGQFGSSPLFRLFWPLLEIHS